MTGIPEPIVATTSNRQCKATPQRPLFSVPPGTYCGHDVKPAVQKDASSLVVFCTSRTARDSPVLDTHTLSGTFFQRCRKRTLGVGGQHWQDVASPWSLESFLPTVHGPQDLLPTGPVMGHVRGDYTSPRNLSYHDCISSQNMCYDDCI